MRRPAGLAALPIALMLSGLAHAQTTQAAADCVLAPDLIFRDVTPALLTVRSGSGSVHFLKGGSQQPGCPGAAAECQGNAYVVAGDQVIVTSTRADYACATFTGTAPKAGPTTGWLPRAALAPAQAAKPAATDWIGDWRYGPEQDVTIRRAAGGHIALRGAATFGGRDPDRVRRGAVNTGEFAATVAPVGDHVAFLVGDGGKPLPLDPQRAKDDPHCGLRLWRLGPYLVVADNLNCGGANVTFTGVYRRAGGPR